MTPTVFTTVEEANEELGNLYAELSYLNEAEGIYGESEYFTKHRKLMGEIHRLKEFIEDLS